MSKNLMIVLVIIALALGGYYYTQKNQAVMEPKDTMMVKDEVVKSDDAMMEAEPTKDDGKMMEESSRYLPFTSTVLAKSSTPRRVLYFYASWCPTCIPANADFEKNASMLPADLTVIRVNYNDPDTDEDEKALAVKYGITYQHTFVQIDQSGNTITTWNGGATKELLAKIK